MKRSLVCLSLAALAAGTIFVPVVRAADDPMEVLKKAQKAQLDAPASRMKMVSTDADDKTSTMTLEFVKPDMFHWKTEENGQVKMEMWSDGKKAVVRKGSGGEVHETPMQISAMMTQAHQSAAIGTLLGVARDLKFVAHETVNGTRASVYTFKTEMMGLDSAAKLWISDKDKRPLKSEAATHGELKIAAGPGHAINKKSTTTYEYDSSIKIVLPVVPVK